MLDSTSSTFYHDHIRATEEDIIKGMKAYHAECKNENKESKYILHPATFLNKSRWKDYIGREDLDYLIEEYERYYSPEAKKRLKAKYGKLRVVG